MSVPLIGVSKEIAKIRELVARVAHTGLNVVITGESGVGKEVVAHELFRQSQRSNKPFVKINCAALPETLLESELFGYDRGAFTGAVKRKKGKFELSNGGTLLLDEIGDMPFSLQAKLLRALQSGEIIPLGSEKEVTIDTWVIATTNQDLEKQIAANQFREDLYYRLNTIRIHIPPLRERPEDIPALIDFYTKRYASDLISQEALDNRTVQDLCNHSWPGNVRELQNVLKRIMVLGESESVIATLDNSKMFSRPMGQNRDTHTQSVFIQNIMEMMNENVALDDKLSLKEVRRKTLDLVEKELISKVLEEVRWNRTNAAKILKISYKTLLYKIDGLKISPLNELGSGLSEGTDREEKTISTERAPTRLPLGTGRFVPNWNTQPHSV